MWMPLEVLAPAKVFRPSIGVLREVISFLEWEGAVATQWRREGWQKVIDLTQLVQQLEDRRDDPQGLQQGLRESSPERSASSSSDEL